MYQLDRNGKSARFGAELEHWYFCSYLCILVNSSFNLNFNFKNNNNKQTILTSNGWFVIIITCNFR